MSASVNRAVVVGNLTQDPDLRMTAAGTPVCRLRVACNTRWRNSDTGEYDERPNYFDVSAFGSQAEACHRYLEKGRPVAVDGRLEWHEWETSDGQRRQSVGIIADSVQFLGSRTRGESDATAIADGAASVDGAEEVVAF